MQPADHGITTLGKPISPHKGAYLPTKGVIRGKVVFVQTLNDELQHESWPLGQLPVWSEAYVSRVRQYFLDMSSGELEFDLDVHPVCAITSNTEEGYLDWGRKFGDAIKEIIDSIDVASDFSVYDTWASQSRVYDVRPEPDGQVDLFIFVFRRITNSKFMSFTGVSDLGFKGYKFVDGSLDRFFYGGSGSFNDASASGVSLCRRPGYGVVIDPDFAFGVTVHEIGHKLLGDGHPTELFGGLGLMANAGNGLAMNSFEKHLAGYISFRDLNPHRDTTVVLRDYVTTGDAVLLPVPEALLHYYSFEFRGKFSEWDTAPMKGLYGFRIFDSYGFTSKSIQVLSAEGRFDWALDSTTMTIYPVRPNPLTGFTRLQRIRIDDKYYVAEGCGYDSLTAFTLQHPEFAVLKNPTPDFIFSSDTVHTGLRITLIAMDDSSATLRISYAEPVILDVERPSAPGFSLGAPYPQPAESGSMLRIPVTSERDGYARVDMFNMLGRRLLHLDRVEFGTRGELLLPLHDIPAGIHTLIVQAGAQVRRLRISVVSR